MERKRLSLSSEGEEHTKRLRLEEVRQYVQGFEFEDLDGDVEEGDRAICDVTAQEILPQQAVTSATINVSCF